jgi:8-oxo-dGTP pyrophosphatase MutT (NUDIX family)
MNSRLRVARALVAAADALAESLAASVFVFDGDKFLLLKRGSTAPWMPNKWSLPGGVIEPGEQPTEAGVRELEEETGLVVHQPAKVATVRYPDYTLHVFKAELPEGQKVNLTWENQDFAWVTAKEALAMDLVPGLDKLIGKYAS